MAAKATNADKRRARIALLTKRLADLKVPDATSVKRVRKITLELEELRKAEGRHRR